MSLRFWITALVMFLALDAASAQPHVLEAGKPMPVLSATAATGPWLQRAAFNRDTYGKVRGVSPGTSPEPKVVLYTSVLNADFFKIATTVDNYIAKHPELAWSYVMVTDAKGAQRGGYSAAELRARLDEINALAKAHGIKHLSFLVSASGNKTTEPRKAVLIAYAPKATHAGKHPVVSWITEVALDSLPDSMPSQLIPSLDTAIYPNQKPHK